MGVRKWLEENNPPDWMPNIDVLYSAGAKYIGVVHSDSDKMILSIELPDDLEKAIDVMVAIANSLQGKVTHATIRGIMMTTYRSPHTD